jgi:hypothetical protein
MSDYDRKASLLTVTQIQIFEGSYLIVAVAINFCWEKRKGPEAVRLSLKLAKS